MTLRHIWRRYIRHGFAAFVCCIFFVEAVAAQQKWPGLDLQKASKAHNIFSADQEMDLGDVEAELLEASFQVIRDREFTTHVTAISRRLLASLPATNVRILLIDGPQAEAFSAGNSRIYITRKMVAMMRNDDELAGLLGHELAHILAHQNAFVVSQAFHDFLGVSSVGDRKDIADKFNRMLNSSRWNTNALPTTAPRIQWEDETDQYKADRFALYAAASAGFSPRAYAEFVDRFAATQGKRGNPLTDLFGITTPNERRLREIYKSLHSLPKSCREILPPTPSPEFTAWQAEVTAPSTFTKGEIK
jgi:predicted Zn-dependent protease